MNTNKVATKTFDNMDISHTRKEAMSKLGKAVKKLVLASIPIVGIGASVEKAKAQYSQELEIGRVLNILLQMEFLLKNFYIYADIDNAVIPDATTQILRLFKKHHTKHILKIKRRINVLKLPVKASPKLSSTYSIENLDPKGSYDDFLQLAQVLNDASTSLYKKCIDELVSLDCPPSIHRTLLLMHTLEARHTAYIRVIRSERGVDDIKPWISNTTDTNVLSVFNDIYENEDNTTHFDIDVSSNTSVPISSVQEAWDEPCSDEAINNLFKLLKVNYY